MPLPVKELIGTKNSFEFFVELYRFVASGARIDTARSVFTPAGESEDTKWSDGTHSIALELANDVGRYSSIDWQYRFDQIRKSLTTKLATFDGLLADRDDVGTCVTLLRLLDPIIGRLLRTSSQTTFPNTPDLTSYTIVSRLPRYFKTYRYKVGAYRVLPIDTYPLKEALRLQFVYLVPPQQADSSVDWEIRRIPKFVDDVLASQRHVRLSMVAMPHSEEYRTVTVDPMDHTFRISTEYSEDILDRVSGVVDRELAASASIVMFPELVGCTALTDRLSMQLKAAPHRVGFILPGSEHLVDASGAHRNRTVALGPTGTRIPSIVHDKVSRYRLPERWLRKEGFEGLADETLSAVREVSEGISVVPLKAVLYESKVIGRFLIVICRDILEAPINDFCRQHELDHIFVLSMTPSLEPFRVECRNLGRTIDAGIYVVNTHGCPTESPAVAYLPLRGYSEPSDRPTPDHRVCVSTVEFARKGPRVTTGANWM